MSHSSNVDIVTHTQLRLLRQVLGDGPVIILSHSNPDPDALASGAGLACLFTEVWGIKTRLAYSGLVGRAENKMVLELLTPGWEPLDRIDEIGDYRCCVLVDTQPETGNNLLPRTCSSCVVIDHHPLRKNLDSLPYVDVRTDIGATSSLVYCYLEAAGYAPDARLATALFYGIQTDTQGLSRVSSSADRDIYIKLLSMIDQDLLVQVIQAGVPREYFQSFYDGLRSSRVYHHTVVSYLGAIDRPDFPAELADFLIRLESVQAVLCLGFHEETLYLSLRAKAAGLDAGVLIQRIVATLGTAGGHGTYAGGQIPLAGENPQNLAFQVSQKFLLLMGEQTEGENLLSAE